MCLMFMDTSNIQKNIDTNNNYSTQLPATICVF